MLHMNLRATKQSVPLPTELQANRKRLNTLKKQEHSKLATKKNFTQFLSSPGVKKVNQNNIVH